MGSQSNEEFQVPDDMFDSGGRCPVRLLLVDDHAGIAEATAEYLKTAGLDVRLAQDGKEALETAEAFRPQIVLCDLMLPDLSALELVPAIRSNRHTRHIVFALYTALGEADVRALEREHSGAIDLFFSKPLTPEKLE